MNLTSLLPANLSLPEIMARFPDDASAITYFESLIWPNGPTCPQCGNTGAFYPIKAKGKTVRAGVRQCAECRRQFRVTVGTIFEDSHIPLNQWLIAWYLLAGAKKGMSAMQLQRHLGLGSYKSAWFLAHRIRHAMAIVGEQLSGSPPPVYLIAGRKTAFN